MQQCNDDSFPILIESPHLGLRVAHINRAQVETSCGTACGTSIPPGSQGWRAAWLLCHSGSCPPSLFLFAVERVIARLVLRFFWHLSPALLHWCHTRARPLRTTRATWIALRSFIFCREHSCVHILRKCTAKWRSKSARAIAAAVLCGPRRALRRACCPRTRPGGTARARSRLSDV